MFTPLHMLCKYVYVIQELIHPPWYSHKNFTGASALRAQDVLHRM